MKLIDKISSAVNADIFNKKLIKGLDYTLSSNVKLVLYSTTLGVKFALYGTLVLPKKAYESNDLKELRKEIKNLIQNKILEHMFELPYIDEVDIELEK